MESTFLVMHSLLRNSSLTFAASLLFLVLSKSDTTTARRPYPDILRCDRRYGTNLSPSACTQTLLSLPHSAHIKAFTSPRFNLEPLTPYEYIVPVVYLNHQGESSYDHFWTRRIDCDPRCVYRISFHLQSYGD